MVGGIAVGVFLVEYILLYKKSEELHLEPAAFLQGGSLKIL